MLIRIVDHFRNNPKRIDKLMAIKGLPKEWFFTEQPEGTELKKPWMPDVDVNIPYSIRHLCEPMYIVIKYSPIERGQAGVVEKRQILGVKIDYNTEPGREMWEQVERYIEESIPRNERVPVAVVCAKDERSAFETYTPRRSSTGSLEMVPAQVPEVDLTKYEQVIVQPSATPPPGLEVEPVVSAPQVSPKLSQAGFFTCEVCSTQFPKAQGLRMHKMKRHPKTEKVGAT